MREHIRKIITDIVVKMAILIASYLITCAIIKCYYATIEEFHQVGKAVKEDETKGS